MKIIRRCRKNQWLLHLCTTIEQYCDPHYPTGFCGQSLGIMHKKQLFSIHLAHTITRVCPHLPTLILEVVSQEYGAAVLHSLHASSAARGKHKGVILCDSHITTKKKKSSISLFHLLCPGGGGDYNKYKTVSASDRHFHI